MPALSGESGLVTNGDTEPTDTRGQKLLDDRLAQLVTDREKLARDAKLALILLAVLLLLYREYMPMVAADYQIEHRLGEQVRSLVLLEGHLNRLNRVFVEAFDPWKTSVDGQIDEAFQRVVALDTFAGQLLSSDPNSTPAVPEFVRDCAEDGWMLPHGSWSTGRTFSGLWQSIVDQCIIAPIDDEFVPPPQHALADQLEVVRDDMNVAVNHARTVFEIAPLAATVTPTPTPGSGAGVGGASAAEQMLQSTPTPGAALALVDGPNPITVVLTTPTPAPPPPAPSLRETLDAIEWEVNWAAQLTSRLPSQTTNPAASVWWEMYATEDGYWSLRSFRDNLFLEYVRPELFGGGQSLNADVSRLSGSTGQTAVLPLVFAEDPSTGLTRLTLQNLLSNVAVTRDLVRDEQTRLQAEIVDQISELEAAVPDFAKPVLAIARPRYLVLGYPLLAAGVAAYLMIGYTLLKVQIRQWRQEYETADMKREVLNVGLAEPPLAVLAALLAAALALLAFLRFTNDWPQLLDGDWNTAFWVAVGIVVITAVGCGVFLVRVSRNTGANPAPAAAKMPPDDY